jgi:ABC-2 type transport system permease protein
MMLWTVLTRELRSIGRDGRLLTLSLGLALAFIALLADSAAAVRAADALRAAAAKETREQWDHQGMRHPHRGAHFGLYAFKGPSLLAVLEPGIEPQVGQMLWLEPHRRNMARDQPALDSAPSTGLAPRAPSFALLALIPLLLIGLGHQTVSGERESGTLRMHHAAGLPASVWLLGKWLALLSTIVAMLIPLALMGAGWLWVQTNDADLLLRSAFMFATLFTVCAIVTAGVVCVSATARSSRMALLLLLGVWIAWVFFAPQVGSAVASSRSSVPSGAQFWKAIASDIEMGLPGDGDAAERQKAFDERLLSKYRVSRLEDLPIGAAAVRRLERDAYAADVYALHFNRLWSTWQRQQDWYRMASAWSPLVAARSVLMEMSGTSLAAQRAFEMEAEAYRQDWTARIDRWDMQARAGVGSFDARYADDEVWRDVPAFEPSRRTFGAAWREALPDILVVGFWSLLCTGLLALAPRSLKP